jgi:PAS domain-containing protein
MIEERFAEVLANDGALRGGEAQVYSSGEMAECIREFAWERTSVGPMARWPESFLCAVNLMLESQFPTVLLWGPELVVMYNDAYQPLMAEKHPGGLGRAAEDCWREAWHLIGPRFAAVMRRGERFYFENNLVPVTRQGILKDVYWTYSYSPVRDGAGRVSGVLVVCHDVTEKLATERERDAIAASLKHVLESTTDGLATLDKEWRYTYMNEQGARMVGMRPVDLVGKVLWELFPEAAENQFGRSIGWRWRRGRRDTSIRIIRSR